jgi:hypothetical protein
LEAAELYADGLITKEDVTQARKDAAALWWILAGRFAEQTAARAAELVATQNITANYAYPSACAVMAGRDAKIFSGPEGVRHQAKLVLCIIGNPFRGLHRLDPGWLRWNDGTVPKVAQHIYEERAFGRLPILADALLDAGCDDEDILAHCRGEGPHVRGCWVIDLILGKQ